MLILTRKSGTSIKIGDNIEITIVGVRGDQVRVGIVAPKNVRVDRNEIRARIDAGLRQGNPTSAPR